MTDREVSPKPRLSVSSSPRLTRDMLSSYILTPGRLPNIVQQTPSVWTGAYEHVTPANFILADDTVSAALEKRFAVTTAIPYKVLPRSEQPIDLEIADYCTRQLEKIGYNAIVRKMLYFMIYGYSVAEVLWGYDTDDNVIIRDIKVRAAPRFIFDANSNMRLRTKTKPMRGIPLPKDKFWEIRNPGTSDDTPYGNGFTNALYNLVMFKKQGFADWSIALQRFATPIIHGIFTAGKTAAKQDELEQILADVKSGGHVVTGDNVQIELKQNRQRTGPSYKEFEEYIDRKIERVCLGASGTQESVQYQAGVIEVSKSIEQIISADNRLVNRTFTNDVLYPLVKWQFGMEALPPILERQRDRRASEDSKRLAELFEIITRITGKQFDDDTMEREFGIKGLEDRPMPNNNPPPTEEDPDNNE